MVFFNAKTTSTLPPQILTKSKFGRSGVYNSLDSTKIIGAHGIYTENARANKQT